MNQPKTLLQGKPLIPSDSTDVQATWKAHGWKPQQVEPTKYTPDDYDLVTRDDWLSAPGGFK